MGENGPEDEVEIEGKGLDYERYAMNRLFRGLVAAHGLRTVLEIPAGGEKAMPSIYSLPFAQAGCAVTLVNGVRRSAWAWERLGLPVAWVDADELTDTGLERNRFDLVWNFMALAQSAHKEALIAEMARLSRRYLLFVAVNRFNPGFFSHRLVHRINGVPWSHGEVAFMNPFATARFLRRQGLRIVQTGVVDAPPYPDSLGFRDMRLHRKGQDLSQLTWESRSLDWLARGRYPLKLHLLSIPERLPLPWPFKLIYAHLFFILAEKTTAGPGHETT